MNQIIFFLLFLANIFNLREIYPKSKKLFTAYACKLADGRRMGNIQKNIRRAGVIVVVKLDNKESNVFENYGIIVGFDKNLKSWMIGQAGKCDDRDLNTAITAARELEEETGGYYKISPDIIQKMPYLSAYGKQMFIHISSDLWLPDKIKKAVKKIQFDINFTNSYKEINDIEVVSLQALLNLAEKIDTHQVKRGKYFVKSVTGKIIRLNTLYAELFAHRCDHDRIKYFKTMFNGLAK